MLADTGQAGAEGAVALLGVVDGHAEAPTVLRRVARGPGSQRGEGYAVILRFFSVELMGSMDGMTHVLHPENGQ